MKIGKNARVAGILALAAATVGVVAATAWNSAPVGEGKTVHVMLEPT